MENRIRWLLFMFTLHKSVNNSKPNILTELDLVKNYYFSCRGKKLNKSLKMVFFKFLKSFIIRFSKEQPKTKLSMF